jgi:predicted glycogen debranching enzyme
MMAKGGVASMGRSRLSIPTISWVDPTSPPPILVARDACRDLAVSSKMEWLETDGCGGFAMGTVAGVATRRYHGLLVPALRPPADRHVLLSRVEETVLLAEGRVELATAQYPGTVTPAGHRSLERFRIDPFPIWTYEAMGARIEKQVFMVHGEPTVVVQYRSERVCRIRVDPLVTFRSFHALTHANGVFDASVVETPRAGDVGATMVVRPYASLPAMTLHHNGVGTREGSGWYYRNEYLEELDRGLDFREDLFRIGSITFDVGPDAPAWLVATITSEAWSGKRVAQAEDDERDRRETHEKDPLIARLQTAADVYRVRAADGRTSIIAGYPWFADWGRDAMIALPGLLIARGLVRDAQQVVQGFLEHADRGIIPNRFVDDGSAPEYNTADGTLWLFRAVDELRRAGCDPRFVRDAFYPRAKEILAWHERGTHHGIRVDPEDGLLCSGGPGTQLTWMDARIGDWVVTPRDGKAVEINALYYDALKMVEGLGIDYGDPDATTYGRAAARVRESFLSTFWDPSRECLFDVVRNGQPDRRVRPNQIFAVSLPRRMLSAAQMRSVVSFVERHLLTPFGLRTLARDDAKYRARYCGDTNQRDSAYHQGTVWPWLLGPFITAYLAAFGRTRGNVAYCMSLLAPLEQHLTGAACLGHVSEIFDGDVPHAPRGAPAQAWSVAELLRVLVVELGEASA